MADLYEDEKFLKDAGWKVHSKEDGKKFWESPHDHRVYSFAHALIAQSAADVEKKEKLRLAAIEHQQEGLEDLDRFILWEEGTLEEIAPLPKKKKRAAKKQIATKPSKKSRAKKIKELGF